MKFPRPAIFVNVMSCNGTIASKHSRLIGQSVTVLGESQCPECWLLDKDTTADGTRFPGKFVITRKENIMFIDPDDDSDIREEDKEKETTT